MSDLYGCRCVSGSSRGRGRGFTLIEIMVVVVIIGLLAAMVVPAVVHNVERARIARARHDIQSLQTALAMFKLDNSRYPSTEQGLAALVEQPTDPSIRHWREGGYLADGQPGGEGADADIGNWNISD